MSGHRTAGSPLVTAAEWFAGGQRIPYDPESARVLTEEEAAALPGASATSRPATASAPRPPPADDTHPLKREGTP